MTQGLATGEVTPFSLDRSSDREGWLGSRRPPKSCSMGVGMTARSSRNRVAQRAHDPHALGISNGETSKLRSGASRLHKRKWLKLQDLMASITRQRVNSKSCEFIPTET